MGLFDKMSYEEAFAVLASKNPAAGDLKKAHKVIDRLDTGDKRKFLCFALLNMHGM